LFAKAFLLHKSFAQSYISLSPSLTSTAETFFLIPMDYHVFFIGNSKHQAFEESIFFKRRTVHHPFSKKKEKIMKGILMKRLITLHIVLD